ncbi:unnamed protein product [Lactuca saligna]|uniref:Uncharacterized protein n=1 Tax=Lactuca saligna TaxID=75948 RepID=A0AA36EHW6_LACSI|nr:unnamed protein product [Lactuca saligna]
MNATDARKRSQLDGSVSESETRTDIEGAETPLPLPVAVQQSLQTKPEVITTSNAPVPPVNASPTSSPAGQMDPTAIMSQMVANPALDGLLSGVSSQTGIGDYIVFEHKIRTSPHAWGAIIAKS